MSESRVLIETPEGPMEGHFVLPAQTRRGERAPGVLVAPEAYGVNGHIQSVCRRLASEGYAALAPDIYHREGAGIVVDYGDFENARPLLATLSDSGLTADLLSALSFLDAHPDLDPSRIGIVGFCVGGYVAYLAACRTHVSAAVCFYGGGIVTARPKSRLPALLPETGRIRCPVLGIFGEDDASILPADVEALRDRLASLHKEAEVVVYPGAGHGFFCEERPSYRKQAADDAWRRTLDLLHRRLRARIAP